jgi:hemolysin activation/secretion protein
VWISAPLFAAPVLPGPADAGRIGDGNKMEIPDRSEDGRVAIPSIMPSVPVPEGADKIQFVLKDVDIQGLTAFTPEHMRDIYAPYIGKKVGLDTAWKIVGEITKRYRDAGYFLSRAYIPEQRMKDGVIKIRIVEGYIKKVDLELPDDIYAYRLIKLYIARLVSQKPIDTDAVESFLLRINDLPGYSFRGVLSTLDESSIVQDAVKLTLIPSQAAGKGSITFDNYSSRFLDPNEVSSAYSASLLSLQKTTVSGITNLAGDKLQHAAINHKIAIAPDFTLELGADYTRSKPGFTLSRFDIESEAMSQNVSINYQWIRQRQKNLALKFTLDNKDVTTDSLNSPLTRDHIHAFRAGAVYDMSDKWQGYNIATGVFSQGLDIAGANKKSDPYLSRAGAVSDFSKVEWSLSRLQNIIKNWSVLFATAGQWSSDILYSSEQFGYGGQSFGRAYDTSEITGDKGLSGSLELRYGAYGELEPIGLQPYVFFDAGQVWNNAAGQPKSQAGSSFGLGLHFTTRWNQFGNVSLAWPLAREIATPIYGGGEHGPRLIFRVTHEFE